jgi:hypothetical protein
MFTKNEREEGISNLEIFKKKNEEKVEESPRIESGKVSISPT